MEDFKRCTKCSNKMQKGRLAGNINILFVPDEEKGVPLLARGKSIETKAHKCGACGFIEIFAGK